MLRGTTLVLLLAACGHPGTVRPEYAPVDLPRIDSEDDLALAMDEHAAIPVGHPQRDASRAAIRDWLLTDLSANLRRGRPEIAFDRFTSALRLYDADELSRPEVDEKLLRAAERIREPFARRGGEREVLTALAVRLTFSPRDREALARYERLCRWVAEVEPLVRDRISRGHRLIDIHELIVSDLPSPFVRERLEKLYWNLHSEVARRYPRGLPPASRGSLGTRRILGRLGYRLSALQLRAGTLEGALAALRRVRGEPGDDPEARDLLEAATSTRPTAGDFVSLALHYASRDADASERVCRAGIRKLGEHPDLLACGARMAARNERILLGLKRARHAVAARPDSPAVRELMARLLQVRVSQLVQRERLDAASRTVDEAVEFLAETRRRIPSLALDPSSGAFRYILAVGYYNTGDVARAEELLLQATGGDPPPDAYEQLGIIQWRRGRFDDALASYASASRIPVPQPTTALELAARLRRREGDALRDKGSAVEARRAWREAIQLWDRYVFEEAQEFTEGRLEAIAKAQVARARLLYELGETEQAFRAIELAIDAAPGRGETYVDSVALLATRGHVAQATAAFHRALGQPTVSDYYKVYCSLWIYDLGRRSGRRPDALARRYLENVEGNQWHHRLARFAAGRIPYSEMEAQADTPAKKAELFFYEAQNRLAAGRVDEARGLWRRVLGTDMMAFFEYEMAIHYLAAHSD